ncbi:conserved hypothetical protein [Hyella patelloides LEGE 07179]|uniref:DUF6745 domain-containing protein n=1 Tax=Hyella patelloides LEGE 07179 TaxID=945734 RepID=A0A563W1W0_9CYAN|nr:hypothetical protein [Hyella patelloides]VEP17668.1 conserved hypothetical protein [Hyella patelloides LEGE 07179]
MKKSTFDGVDDMSDLDMWSQLTTEQKELARTLHEKWMTVAKCTERIERQQATDAINAVYLAVGLRKVPKIIFVDSPRAAIEMAKQRDKYTGQSSPGIIRFLKIALITRAIENIPYRRIDLPQPSTQQNELGFSAKVFSIAQPQLSSKISNQFWACHAWFLDCAYSVFGCDYISEKWEALQLLVKNCGFVLPFVDICFVSDRPTELLFKDDYILHAENRPAVVFRDGYKIFAYNGVELSMTL